MHIEALTLNKMFQNDITLIKHKIVKPKISIISKPLNRKQSMNNRSIIENKIKKKG